MPGGTIISIAMNIHEISAGHLTLDTVWEILRGNYKLKLGEDAIHRITRCREYLDEKIA